MKRQSAKNQLLTYNDENNIKVIYCFLDDSQLLIQIENTPKVESVDEIKTRIKESLISGFKLNIESFKEFASMDMPNELIENNSKIQQNNIDSWKKGKIDIFRIDSFLDEKYTKGPLYSLFNVIAGKPELAFQVGPLHSLGLP